MSSSSLDENEKEWRLGDPQVAVESTKQYEPIKSDPVQPSEKDIEANVEKHSTRGELSRLQSGISAYSDLSSDGVDAKSTASAKKKWYQKANPLRWGTKPPVPETRTICPEYQAGFFSALTFQWMAPLMVVSMSGAIHIKLR